jgi:hypothetical protein
MSSVAFLPALMLLAAVQPRRLLLLRLRLRLSRHLALRPGLTDCSESLRDRASPSSATEQKGMRTSSTLSMAMQPARWTTSWYASYSSSLHFWMQAPSA